MKIVFRDALSHTSEGEEWLLPDSSLLTKRQPVFLPEFAPSFEAALAVVWRVSRLGKHVGERFVPRYWDAATLAVVTMPAQEPLGANNMLRRAFDGAVAPGRWLSVEAFAQCAGHPVEVTLNGELCRQMATDAVAEQLAALLTHTSRHATLKMGDLLGVVLNERIAVKPDNELRATWGTEQLLTLRYK